MLANEDVLAFAYEFFSGFGVQVALDAVLLLPKTLLSFLEIIRNGVLCQEGVRFLLVVYLRRINECRLELILVYIQAFFVGIRYVKPQRDKRVHDFLHETLINRFTVSLCGDETKSGSGQFSIVLLYMHEEVLFPLRERQLDKCASISRATICKGITTHRVHLKHSLLALVSFPLHPVTV